jgi:hypothetical protein
VRRHLGARVVAAALDYRGALGLSGYFVDRVLAAYSATGKRKRKQRKQRKRQR